MIHRRLFRLDTVGVGRHLKDMIRLVALSLLRVSLGLLMVWWGLDKLVNVEHGLVVSAHFYAGLFSSAALLQAFGVGQTALGVLVILGMFRRATYPALGVITASTLVGVWRSIVDPWGWFLQGANALFYPSVIIFAGVLVLMAFADEDRWVVRG